MDWQEYLVIFAGLTVLLTIGGLVWRLSSRVSAAEVTAIEVARNKLEHDRLSDAFSEHRVDVAKEYVTRQVLRESEDRILSAIRELSDRMNLLFKPHTGPK